MHQVVGAGVDEDGVAGAEGVGGQERRQAGHGLVGGLAAGGVVARRRREHVPRRRSVIDVIAVPGVGHQERLGGDRLGPGALVGGDADEVAVAQRQARRDGPQVRAPAVGVHRQARRHRRPRRAAVAG